MPLFVHQNQFTPGLVRALDTISRSDASLQIDLGVRNNTRGTGQVSFMSNTPASANPFTQTLFNLSVGPVWIGIRAEPDGFSVSPAAGMTLQDVGGTVFADSWAAPTTIDVIYSATGCGPGREFWVDGGGGVQLSIPEPVIVFHELAHAEEAVLFARVPTEAYAIGKENELRAELGEPLRASHAGGCRAVPGGGDGGDGGAGGGGAGSCFVATAAHGHRASALEVEVLRSIRDELVRRTRFGRADFDYLYDYYRLLSPLLIAAMDKDSRLRDLIRDGIIGPTVFLAELIRDFPDADLDGVPAPWRKFLAETERKLASLTSFISPPEVFDGQSVWDAAEELAVTLRYVIRKRDGRRAYIQRLLGTGQLPLRPANPAQRAGVRCLLETWKLGQHEVDAVLGEGW